LLSGVAFAVFVFIMSDKIAAPLAPPAEDQSAGVAEAGFESGKGGVLAVEKAGDAGGKGKDEDSGGENGEVAQFLSVEPVPLYYGWSSVIKGIARTQTLEKPETLGRTSGIFPIYTDNLLAGWENWSWQTRENFAASARVYSGKRAIEVAYLAAWAGLYLHTPRLETREDDVLVFALNGGRDGGQRLRLEFYDEEKNGLGAIAVEEYVAGGEIKPGIWQEVRVPLKDLGAAGSSVTGFSIASENPTAVYFDEFYLVEKATSTKWANPRKEPPPSISLLTATGENAPYQVDLRSLARWEILYGALSAKDGKLYITPGASSTASFVVFAGGESWSDYEFNAVIDWHRGSNVTLVARYRDKNNYLACAFAEQGAAYAEIQHVKDGVVYRPAGHAGPMPVPYFLPWQNVSIGIRVAGNKVECLRDGKWVLRHTSSENLPRKGSIGVKIWGEMENYALVAVKEITVQAIPTESSGVSSADCFWNGWCQNAGRVAKAIPIIQKSSSALTTAGMVEIFAADSARPLPIIEVNPWRFEARQTRRRL
jgi:hypothetical protein